MGQRQCCKQADRCTCETVNHQAIPVGDPRPPFTFPDGATFTGEWHDHDRHGYGLQVWPDGARYEGYWVQNQACGEGRLEHADGDVYEGQFVGGKADGLGVYMHVGGSTYNGTWKDDKQQGEGEETWPDGARYLGQYQDGVKHGSGYFVWADDASYIGEFRKNDINGAGIYTWSDGRRYDGQWEQSRMSGAGTFTWPDGRVYEGGYSFDVKQGGGTFTWPDGRSYRGEWSDGKQHGAGSFISAGGVKHTCNDEMYGRYLWQYCPCACHDELMLQAESGYSYDMNAANGPHNWGDDCQAGGEQSPIDIDTMTSFGLSNVALVRSWDTTSPTGGSFELYNAGHSVVIGLSGSLQASNLPFINRPYLTDKDYTFNLAHVHFHWGSEHTLNGYRYPLEAHFVHVNAAYASVEEALGFSDGLLVVGVFYHLAAAGEQESASLASAGFASQAADLDGNNYPLGDFDPNELVPSNLEYYSYAGGLTTPPCSRVVTWVVASQSLPVSNATLTNFLMTKDSHGHYVAEHGNYRPVQPLAGRGLVQYTSMP